MKTIYLLIFSISLFMNGCTPPVEPKIVKFNYKSGSFELSGVRLKNDFVTGETFSDSLAFKDTTSINILVNDTILLNDIKQIISSNEQGGFTYVMRDLITINLKVLIDFDKKNIKYLELYYQLDHQRVAIEFDLTQKQILTYKIQLNDLPYQIASDGMITAYFMPFSDISKIKLFNFENSTSSMLGPNTDSQTIEYNAVHSLLPDSKLKITLKPD